MVPTTQETLNDIRKSMQRIEKLAARWEKATPLAEDTMREYRDLARSGPSAVAPEGPERRGVWELLVGLDARTQAIAVYVHLDGMTQAEAAALLRVGRFPVPDPDHYHYPWPLV